MPAVIHRGGEPDGAAVPAPYRRTMRLHLTVAYRSGSPPWHPAGDAVRGTDDAQGSGVHEVECEAPEGCTAADLALALVGAQHRGTERVLAVAGSVVDPQAVVGLPPLVDGAALVLTTPGDPSLSGPSDVRSTRPRTPVTLAMTHGPDAGHVHELAAGRHVVGRSPSADLRLDDDGISRLHVEVDVGPDGITVRDLASTNGTLLDGHVLGQAATRFSVGSRLVLGASVLALGQRPTVPAATVRQPDGTRTVNRRPRTREAAPSPTITLPAPPPPARRQRVPWVAVLLPLPVAAVMAVFLGPTMLAFALMGPVVMLGTTLSDRWGTRRTYEAECRAHAARLRDAQDRLDDACATELRAARRADPDAAALLGLSSAPDERLWERSGADPDLLTVAVGRCTRPASLRAVRPPGDDGPEHPLLHDAPCTVPLETVGVFGLCGDMASRAPVARQLVGRLVAQASPRDLELVVVAAEPQDGERWGWVLRLPHLRETDGSRRGGSTGVLTAGPGSEDTASTSLALLAQTVRARRTKSGAGPGPTGRWAGPWTLLVVEGAARFRGLPDLATILHHGPAVGVVTLALDDDRTRLPSETGGVLVMRRGRAPVLDLPGHQHQDLVVDGVGPWWTDRLSRALAGLRDASPAAATVALPPSTGLLTLCDFEPPAAAPGASGAPFGAPGAPGRDPGPAVLEPTLLARRWQEVPHATRVPLGAGSGGTLHVDLATDGPHVLVAGTTGAGKSELLRTWVASLALHHRPEHLSLVLVDYKGGAAFRECADLPHVTGVVTDLDGPLADRALRSLTAELTRRERVLAEAGSSDFVEYQRSDAGRRRPLARLVVVIDEFRALAEELPAFVDGLVRLAALGRSLGIHLVLATQRPAGVVTADIKANVNLRIALRVRDRADSDDVIDAPDAAALDQSLPGRAFARVGGGDLVPFQVAHVGGALTRETLSTPRCRTIRFGSAPTPWESAGEDLPTELAAVVAAARGASELLGAAPPPRAWLPPLPTRLAHHELEPTGPNGVEQGRPDARHRVPLGLVDRPDSQAQEPLELDLRSSGHWAFVGASGSGRTTALLTAARGLAARRGPTELHLYAVSGGGLAALSGLPHLGAHVDWTDPARLERLVDRLAREVADRREALTSRGFRSMQEWWSAGGVPDGCPEAPPPLLLLIDDWDLLVHHTDGLGLGAGLTPGPLSDRLLALLREGDGVGLTGMLSGDRSLLLGRGAAAATHRVVLRLADRGDAALAGLPDLVTRPGSPPGRGWLPDRAEVQLALPPTAPPLAFHASARGHLAPRVDALPTRVPAGNLASEHCGPGALPLGVGGDESRTLALTPGRDGRRWLVAGARGSGISTTLLHLAEALLTRDHPVAVVTPRPGPLDQLHADARVAWCGTDADALVRARRRHPALAVLVDAGDELLDHPVEPVLREVLQLVDRDKGLVVVGADATALAAMYRGVAVEVGRHRTGILLGPSSAGLGEPLGVRVPVDRGARPGRGHLVRQGATIPLQVALPDAHVDGIAGRG